MAFKKAVRKRSPLLVGLGGVSGSGKTYTSCLVGAGLAGPNGRVGFLDTENGRGSMYADDPEIMKALPNGYLIDELTPPYSPDRYIEKIEDAQKEGVNVLLIDSVTHEWEGIGGCAEIAETKKLRNGQANWMLAKMLHKRFMNRCLAAQMDIIFCIRARDKVKPIKKPDGEVEWVPIGLQPITEKNFMFEMTLSFMIDETTHFSSPVKVPRQLKPYFPGGKLLTKEDGAHLREWAESGVAVSPGEILIKQSRAIAAQGMDAYKAFYSGLSTKEKHALAGVHEENKYEAEQVDAIQNNETDAGTAAA